MKAAGKFSAAPNLKHYFPQAKIGTWAYYNESGKLIKEEFYEEGKLVKTVEY